MFFLHRKKHRHWLVFSILGLLGVGMVIYQQRVALRDIFETLKKEELPLAVGKSELGRPSAEPANTEDITEQNLPEEINLKIPYTVQAPRANWDEEHREFCEEASVLMVARYFQGKTIPGPDEAEAALQDIKQWEIANLGFHKDTTAAETARILREKFKLKDVETIVNPTLLNIKAEVAAGNPVIVPAAGRLIGNPFYRQPGPLYHMLVIKGYTKDGKLITNDPGTRRGADYVYPPSTIMNAIHDWNDGDVANGQKVVIVVRNE